MNRKATLFVIVLATAPAMSGQCLADEDRVSVGFNASAGAGYDSDVGVADLDENSGEADSRTDLAAGVDVKFAAGERFALRLGYHYSGSAYRRFPEFDLAMHHALAEMSFDFGTSNAAIAAHRYRTILDADRFLTIRQISPSLSHLFGTRLYLRGAYLDTHKEYVQPVERDADAGALRLDTYLLFDGMDHYVSLGFQSGAENAVDPQLDFDTHQAGLAYGRRLEFPRMEMQVAARMRFERRDYRNVTEAIGEARRDRRRCIGLTAGIPFSDHIGIEGDVERRHHVSNLDTADLDEIVYAVKLTAKF